ncbi:hypothetical protein D3C80_2173170 [compost metagenome]
MLHSGLAKVLLGATQLALRQFVGRQGFGMLGSTRLGLPQSRFGISQRPLRAVDIGLGLRELFLRPARRSDSRL